MVPPIDTGTPEEERGLRDATEKQRGGAEEVGVILHGVVPRDEPDERGARLDADLPAHLGPGRGVRAEGVGVEAVGDDAELPGRKPPPRVLVAGLTGTADDPRRQPPRQPGAR